VLQLLVTANIVPSSPILVTLMIEALSSSETSVLTRATRRNIPETFFNWLFPNVSLQGTLCEITRRRHFGLIPLRTVKTLKLDGNGTIVCVGKKSAISGTCFSTSVGLTC
jgi:hypothetical protein